MQEKSKESGQMLRQFKKTTFIRIKRGEGFIVSAQGLLLNPGLCLHRQSDIEGLSSYLDNLVKSGEFLPWTPVFLILGLGEDMLMFS